MGLYSEVLDSIFFTNMLVPLCALESGGAWAGLYLAEVALHVAALFDLDFGVLNRAADLARGSDKEGFVGGDVLVNLAAHVDQVGGDLAFQHAGTADQDFAGGQIPLDRSSDGSAVRHHEAAVELHTLADDQATVFAGISHRALV